MFCEKNKKYVTKCLKICLETDKNNLLMFKVGGDKFNPISIPYNFCMWAASWYWYRYIFPFLMVFKKKETNENPIIVHLLRFYVNKCVRKLASETFILHKLVISTVKTAGPKGPPLKTASSGKTYVIFVHAWIPIFGSFSYLWGRFHCLNMVKM